MDLGKLNFLMVVWFQAQANFQHCPSRLKKILLDSKVIKINPKIIISLCLSKSVTYSVEVIPNYFYDVHYAPHAAYSIVILLVHKCSWCNYHPLVNHISTTVEAA